LAFVSMGCLPAGWSYSAEVHADYQAM